MGTLEVYKITNRINGKIYIGITNQGAKIRFQDHISDSNNGSSFPIHSAIRKYGVENFQIEVIENLTDKDYDYLKEREKYWIKEFDSYKKGYNCTLGGDGTFGRFHSEETKEKIRQKAIGRKVSNTTKENMRRVSPNKKEVKRFTTEGKYIDSFNSCQEAARFFGKKDGSPISKAAKNFNKTLYGYRWAYTNNPPKIQEKIITKKEVRPRKGFKQTEETKSKLREANLKLWVNPKKREIAKRNVRCVPILQYDLDGNFIKEFFSVSEAAREIEGSRENISKCLRGIYKKSCGFIWKYKDNN